MNTERLRILVDPTIRSMSEIFSPTELHRLQQVGQIVWGRDDAMPGPDFIREVPGVDAVVFGGWRHGEDALEAALTGGRTKALLEVAGGHEHDLDYRRCLDHELLIGSCAPAFTDVVAEMALTLALSSARGVVAADRAMEQSAEAWLHGGNVDNTTLLGATVGFVGCGGISRSLQRLLEPFGVNIVGYDPPMPTQVLIHRGIEPAGLEELFDHSQVVFVLAAPTADNIGLVSRELMERLDRGQSLVIVSRGRLVDFEGLAELAGQGRFKVATDVYPTEPLDDESPLRRLDNVITVPHIAGALPQALLGIGRRVVDDLEALAAGREPTAMQYLTTSNLAALRQTPTVRD